MWVIWAVLIWMIGSIPLALWLGKIMARASKDYDRVAYGAPKVPVRLP